MMRKVYESIFRHYMSFSTVVHPRNGQQGRRSISGQETFTLSDSERLLEIPLSLGIGR